MAKECIRNEEDFHSQIVVKDGSHCYMAITKISLEVQITGDELAIGLSTWRSWETIDKHQSDMGIELIGDD